MVTRFSPVFAAYKEKVDWKNMMEAKANSNVATNESEVKFFTPNITRRKISESVIRRKQQRSKKTSWKCSIKW